MGKLSSTGETMNRVSVEQSDQEEDPRSDQVLQSLKEQAAFLAKQNEARKAELLRNQVKADRAAAKQRKHNEAALAIKRL